MAAIGSQKASPRKVVLEKIDECKEPEAKQEITIESSGHDSFTERLDSDTSYEPVPLTVVKHSINSFSSTSQKDDKEVVKLLPESQSVNGNRDLMKKMIRRNTLFENGG